MMTRLTAVATLACAVWTSSAWGLFMKPDLEKIPVEKLAKKLEEKAKADPKNVEVLFNLARLHAMAFALKTDTVEINKGNEERGAWMGFVPGAVPFKSKDTDDKAKQKAAKEHLDKAIATYQDVIKKDDKHLKARLGLGWCLDQAKEKDKAIKEYRATIEKAWEEEGKLDAGRMGGYITVEAASYLIPLLDATKDKKEIDTLNDRTAKLNKLPRPMTPIAVPLRDGLPLDRIEKRDARVRFDADGTGIVREWSWIHADAGWLVYDPKGSGKITSGLQMFGGVAFFLYWDNGYNALAALDDNDDGQLTGNELDGLALWHDKNGNGISEKGEVKPLAEMGIVALSCKFERDHNHTDRIAFSPKGVTFKGGTVRPTYDIVLHPAVK